MTTIKLAPTLPPQKNICIPLSQMFSEVTASDSAQRDIADCYYKPQDQGALLSERTLKRQQQYSKLVQEAVTEGALTAARAQEKTADFKSGNLGPYQPNLKPQGNAPTILSQIEGLEGDQFALIRQPQQCADGLYRPMDFYVSPGHLQISAIAKGWETSKSSEGVDLPVADVVVIGAGPGGLSTAWQLARRGGRVVCFESELAGSNFNDGGAKSVHHMRTSVELTNIIREGNGLVTRENSLSLDGNIERIRPLAEEARLGMKNLSGEEIHGIPVESRFGNNPASPAARAELWEHLSEVAHSLATDFDNAFLCERSPVSDVQYKDGLFTVKTSRGHEVKCKELVISTGLTGSRGERAKSLPVLDKLAQEAGKNAIVLQKISDTQSQATELAALTRGVKKATLIVNDRLMGDQTFRQAYASFPEGSRAAVVGSGESAIKAALELAHLNPKAKVDLFVKGTLESAQVQVPSENFNQVAIEKTLHDPVRSAQLWDMYQFYDTPVTPRSLQEVFELQREGRMRVVELGAFFDEQSVRLQSQADGSTLMEVADPKVRQTIAKNQIDYKTKNLMPLLDGNQENTVLNGVNYQAIVQAAGYSKLKLAEHPLAQLGEEALTKIHSNSIADATNPAQTALPGLGTAGRHIAEDLATRLVPDSRRLDANARTGQGDQRNYSDAVVDFSLTHGGLMPNFVESINKEIQAKGGTPLKSFLTFPSGDRKLRDLANANPDNLSYAEREVLERGKMLQKRLREAVPQFYKFAGDAANADPSSLVGLYAQKLA